MLLVFSAKGNWLQIWPPLLPPPPQQKKTTLTSLVSVSLFVLLFPCCCCTSMKFTFCWCIAFVFALLATTNFWQHFSVFRFSESKRKGFTLTTAIPNTLQSWKMLFLKIETYHRRTKAHVIAFQLKKRETILGFWKKETVTKNFILFVNWVRLRKASRLFVYPRFS